MKHKPSISHDEAMVRVRQRPDFAAEYLKAALEDMEEPGVLLVALRRVAEARAAWRKWQKLRASNARASTGRYPRAVIRGGLRWLP